MRVITAFFIFNFLLLQSSCRLVDNSIKRRGISSENPTDSTPAPVPPSDPAILLKQWKSTLPVAFTNDVSLTSMTSANPQVAINNTGDAIVVWQQSNGTYNQVFKSEYRSGAWTHPNNIHDNVSPDGQSTLYPQVVINDSGDAIIVWQQSDGSSFQIFKSEYRSGSWTHPSGLTDNISPNGSPASVPQVSLNTTGDAVIVWQQSDGSNNQVFKSEYRSGSWTHPSGLTDNISPDGQDAQFPQISVNNSGNALIVWQQSNGTNQTFFKSEYSSGSWTHPSSLSDHMLLGTQTATDIKMSLNNTNQAIITWSDGSYRILSTDNFSGSWVDPYYVKSTTTPYINYEFVQNPSSEKGWLLFSENSGDKKKNGIQLYEFKQ